MTSPIWKNRLDELVEFNRQEMCQNVDARIDEAFDILDTFLTNPAKPLAEFGDNSDDVQPVEPNGEPKVEPAPFIPAQNERDQLMAIFNVELNKQWGYSVNEFKMMHKKCMHHFGCWLTFPMGHIPDMPAYNIYNKEIQTLIAERQMCRQVFHELVDQFLIETKHNLKQAIEENVPAYAGRDDPNFEEVWNILDITAPLMTVEEYRGLFARTEATGNALHGSINRFLLMLKQTFEQMQTFLFEKMENDAAWYNQQNYAPMEDE